jgi:hypothetical protein
MSERKEIQKQFRQQQEKYVYYVLALCVASIGFTVNQTIGQSLSWYKLPAGIAILCWSYSIYSGLYFLRYVISTLFANDTYLSITEGSYPEIGTNKQMQKVAAKGAKQAMDSNSDKAMKLSKRQNALFFIGMTSFITWHILEMIHKTLEIHPTA